MYAARLHVPVYVCISYIGYIYIYTLTAASQRIHQPILLVCIVCSKQLSVVSDWTGHFLVANVLTELGLLGLDPHQTGRQTGYRSISKYASYRFSESY